MFPITAVLGSREFRLCTRLGAQGGSQLSAGREDFADGSAVLSTLSEGLVLELSDLDTQNATLEGDYLRLVVEIEIGGVPTVLEIGLICLFMSVCIILLEGCISTNLFYRVRQQADIPKVEVCI